MIPVMGVARLRTPEYPGGEVEIKDGQVAAIESISPLKFTIRPRAGNEPQVLVETPRSVPENFKVGIDVGLRGSYDAEKNLFRAYHISTKCPSKYEASKDGEATESGYRSGSTSSGSTSSGSTPGAVQKR
jgi:cytochrome c-type biogenesis protein CcmE